MRSVLTILRRVADWFPWTVLGVLLAALSGAALWWFAFDALDLVLLVVGYGTVGLLSLSTTFVLAAAAITKLRLRAATASDLLRLETSRAQPSGFRLGALAWLPLVQLRWEWVTPVGFDVTQAAGRELHETVVAHRRGRYDSVTRRVLVSDVFGAARIGLRHRATTPMEVLPHVGALRQMPVLVSMAGGEDFPHPMGVEQGDRVELRRYAPGDPARFIHWKVFSRTRKLMVRMPERALTQSTRTVAYLVAGEGDDATAGAARVAIESRAFGDDWLFAADGSTPCKRAPDAIAAIVDSSAHAARGGLGLSSFLREAERSGPASAVVFVPPVPGSWLKPTMAALAARRGRAKIVIGVDGLRSMRRRPWWRRLATRAPRSTDTAIEPLDQVLSALASLRIEVLVIDRKQGRVLGEKHRAAVLARAA